MFVLQLCNTTLYLVVPLHLRAAQLQLFGSWWPQGICTEYRVSGSITEDRASGSFSERPAQAVRLRLGAALAESLLEILAHILGQVPHSTAVAQAFGEAPCLDAAGGDDH